MGLMHNGSMPLKFSPSHLPKAAWMPRMAAGEAIVVLAQQERGARYQLNRCAALASESGGAWTVSGTKSVVAVGDQADAFVAAWLPGTQGRGVADVLVAGANGKPMRDFTGRLPFSWPADARSPIDAPLFPLGYGLNYTQSNKLAPVNEDKRTPGRTITGAGMFEG
eukprot:gene52415-71468_t